jgi:hypothetical protein
MPEIGWRKGVRGYRRRGGRSGRSVLELLAGKLEVPTSGSLVGIFLLKREWLEGRLLRRLHTHCPRWQLKNSRRLTLFQKSQENRLTIREFQCIMMH